MLVVKNDVTLTLGIIKPAHGMCLNRPSIIPYRPPTPRNGCTHTRGRGGGASKRPYTLGTEWIVGHKKRNDNRVEVKNSILLIHPLRYAVVPISFFLRFIHLLRIACAYGSVVSRTDKWLLGHTVSDFILLPKK